MEEATMYRTTREQDLEIFALGRVVPVATPKSHFATGWQVAGVPARSREIPQPVCTE